MVETDNKIKVLGVTSSPSTTTEIKIDIIEKTDQHKNPRLLGKMVFVDISEDEKSVRSIGQITSVKTINRWHEDIAFKGVIKQHGRLPNLSERADVRIANISVQSCFHSHENVDKLPVGHSLGISPSTGQEVKEMNNEIMQKLVKNYGDIITHIGTVFGSDDVDMPMWFKHFGDFNKNDNSGLGDALHIGVFGKTGSGKTVMSALILLSYLQTKKMNVLVFDPQAQFANDKKLLPDNKSLKKEIEKTSDYKSYKLLEDISLPRNDYGLFVDLLAEYNYISTEVFHVPEDRFEGIKNAILEVLIQNKNGVHTITHKSLLEDLSNRVSSVYTQDKRAKTLQTRIESIEQYHSDKFKQVQELFSREYRIEDIIKRIMPDSSSNPKPQFIVIDTTSNNNFSNNDSMQSRLLKLIELQIIKRGEELFRQGKQANALIVMDEAHRFISSNDSPNPDSNKLTGQIVNAVRTTRKYGIGHMFITQTLDSLHNEIIAQLRIHVFGFGLTTGNEIRAIKNIINSDDALELYKSFIDPSIGKGYLFMFLGAVSPLSLSGSPLFIEAYTAFKNFLIKNPKFGRE